MRWLKSSWGKRLVVYVAIFGLMYLGACAFLAWAFLHPSRVTSLKPVDLREVKIATGGRQTPAWCTPGLVSGKPSATVYVFAHGYGGSRAHWSQTMQSLAHRRLDSICPAMPGQDASPFDSVGFGPAEADVLVESVRWVRSQSRRPLRIVLVGVSMGGAACWLAADKDPSISAVVTEGAYAAFPRAMNGYLDSLPLGHRAWKPVVFFASRMSGIDPGSIKPVRSAKAWRGRTALVIQAGDDRLIEPWHASKLAEAAACEMWTVNGAAHAQCCDVAAKDYVQRLANLATASTHHAGPAGAANRGIP